MKEREIYRGRARGTFHGWNVPGGNPNSCRGSVLSFGRKRELGGVVLTEEGGSFLIFLLTGSNSWVLFPYPNHPLSIMHVQLNLTPAFLSALCPKTSSFQNHSLQSPSIVLFPVIYVQLRLLIYSYHDLFIALLILSLCTF